MKKIFLAILFLLFVFSAYSNYSVDWVRTSDNYIKNGSMIARDNLDNIISTDYTLSSSIYTRKYDKFSKYKCERSSSSGIHNNYEKALWVNTDAGNIVYVTGCRYTICSQPPYDFQNNEQLKN